MEMYRLFIAVSLPKEVRERLSKVQREIMDSEGVFGSFVDLQNFHITLKYIGLMSASELEDVKAEMKDICERVDRFKMKISGLGAFPDEVRPRVIWAGVDKGLNSLISLQMRFNKAMLRFGAKSDDRFGGHITLARVKKVLDRDELKFLFQGYGKKEFGEFELSEVKLMRSELKRDGPVYSVLAKFNL